MAATTRTARARRIDGNLYDVTYDYSRDQDREVSYRYLESLAARGFRVVVDQSGHRAEGEPKSYEIAPK